MGKNYYSKAVALLLSNRGERSGMPEGYGGNADPSLYIRLPALTSLAKEFLKENEINDKEFEGLLTNLYKGKYDDEKGLASKLLCLNHRYRRQIDPQILDKWLDTLSGWSQVDGLCQSTFPAKEILANWPEWQKLIKKFSRDKNINKRRASLVLLIKSLRESTDPRLEKLAFENIDRLKKENGILITKAISWILREMVKLHKGKVVDYLSKNENALPKIAVRETKKKLETGRKN